MNYLLNVFILLLTQLLIKCVDISAKIDICGNSNLGAHGIDLSTLDLTTWNLIDINKDRIDYNISICGPLSDSLCDTNQYICRQNKSDNRVIGYQPKSIEVESELSSKIQSAIVVFEGPVCDDNPNVNYSIQIRFTCGPHLEFPQPFMDTKCVSHLIWKTYAVCKEKVVQNETKCYVYDNNGFRRDLTPLIKPKGSPHKVLSENQDFYINVCSGVSSMCSESDTGACLKSGDNKYIKVGDYRYNTIEFKSSSGVTPYEHIEMTYKSRSRDACGNSEANFTSVTTIRFICPPKVQKRSIDFMNRNPKLVSALDCEYQVEWMTEYACPLNRIEVSATKCELTEEDHGIDFNLKSLMKSNDSYKIENISLNKTNSKPFYDIEFNVCGGLVDTKCGDSNWNTNAVCLKSREDSTKSKVIGSINSGSLKLVDNKFLLEYKSKSSDCPFGDNSISEKTIIEFICDDSKGFEFKGKPEFVSFEDCTYYIIWKTSVVCPVISSNISCIAKHENLIFDLSSLRKRFGSDPWIASVSQTLPWSRYAKDEKDTIYLNVCGALPKSSSCDTRSSACMIRGESKATVNLGLFSSSPKYNEDIKAIELIYSNGFDYQKKRNLSSKLILRCKAGTFDSDPILVDIDEEKGIYYFEWETWAACPINPFVGNDCKVYDSFLDYTFDLSPLKSKTPFVIKTDDYDYQINVCGEVNSSLCNQNTITTATGPYGICQIEKGGQKRIFSLGKANSTLTYWNGIINVTLTEGTPYNNPEKTARKSEIAFICDPNVGTSNGPEYDGERDRSYFFRWYTPLVCPHTPKTVHCIWENGSHVADLTSLAITSGNHITIGLNTGNGNSLYYINVCRPLNPVHGGDSNIGIGIDGCGADSAACKIMLDSNQKLSLGQPTGPPFVGFDGNINLIYKNGSPCPTNKNKNITTLIKFECDPHSDLSAPIVYEPGSHLTDNEECIYLFEWKTSAVCNAIKPMVKLEENSCVFTDSVTNLRVDLSSLRRPTHEPYKVSVRQNQSTYELNVCGLSNTVLSNECSNSAVCYRSNTGPQQTAVSYGVLTSSFFYYDGKELILRYSNGSKCTAHSANQMMSSEIIFKCNPEAVNSEPRLHSSHACVTVFDWETPLVCGLKPPKCSIIANKTFYNLRQLTSLSHAWNTTSNRNTYFLNVCAKLPKSVECKGLNAASCKCTLDDQNQIDCESLGDPSDHELTVLENRDLLLTYMNGEEVSCDPDMRAQTQITFKCGKTIGNPKFIEFIKKDCVYKFEWTSYIACPVSDINDVLLPERNGFLFDKRMNIFINIKPLITKTFETKERRLNKDNSTSDYTYLINLSSPQLNTTSECPKAAICQTKSDGFKRDVGSYDSIKYFLRGRELQIIVESNATKKCGRNKNKNVTTIFRLQCSSGSGIGEPVFMYESDDCDYTFNWETQYVCPHQFVTEIKTEESVESISETHEDTTPSTDGKSSKSRSNVWIGILIVVFFITTLIVLLVYKQRVRQNLMFKFRRFFGPETTNHTFHYHQLASNEKDRQREEVVFISRNDAQNRNTIAAQPSGHVPYHSIYDDSDVDLLT